MSIDELKTVALSHCINEDSVDFDSPCGQAKLGDDIRKTEDRIFSPEFLAFTSACEVQKRKQSKKHEPEESKASQIVNHILNQIIKSGQSNVSYILLQKSHLTLHWQAIKIQPE